MRHTGLIVTSLAGIAVLVGLGTWQLHRLQWKQALIARIDQSARAEPVSLADIEAGNEHGLETDWLRLRAKGYYAYDQTRRIYALRKGVPGWRLLTPLVRPGETIIFVDRGFLPKTIKNLPRAFAGGTGDLRALDVNAAPADWPKPLQVTGLVRLHGDKPAFAAENDPGTNRWYWYDMQGLAGSLPQDLGAAVVGGQKRLARIMAFTLQLEPGGEAGRTGNLPIVDPVKPKLSNRHLGYALTWYGLALCLAIIAFSFWRKLAREDEA